MGGGGGKEVMHLAQATVEARPGPACRQHTAGAAAAACPAAHLGRGLAGGRRLCPPRTGQTARSRGRAAPAGRAARPGEHGTGGGGGRRQSAARVKHESLDPASTGAPKSQSARRPSSSHPRRRPLPPTCPTKPQQSPCKAPCPHPLPTPSRPTLRLVPGPSRCCCMSLSRRAPLGGSSCVRKDMAKPSHSERCRP